MAITTFTYDDRSVPSVGSDRSAQLAHRESRVSLTYDVGGGQIPVSPSSALATFAIQPPADRILDAGSVRTTCTFDAHPRERLIAKVKSAICAGSAKQVWEAFANDEYWASEQESIARRVECDHHLVEDLIQQTNLQLGIELQQDPTLGLRPEDIETNILPWAFQIVRRRCTLYLRRRLRKQSGNEVFCDVDCFSTSDDRRLNSDSWSSEEIERLRTEIAKLAPADQDVLNMFAEEDRTFQAIADLLMRSKYSVRRALARSLSSLRMRLGGLRLD